MDRAAPACEVCGEPMILRRVFPRTWMLPEVRGYKCLGCGHVCAIEEAGDDGDAGRSAAGARLRN